MKTELQKFEDNKLKTENWLKEAACIDGKCKYVKNVIIEGLTGNMYQLTDSKRGTFFITISQ